MVRPAETNTATAADGTRIYYEVFSPDAANDRRPVLLVMGLGVTGRLWAPAVTRCVGAGFPVITLDNRGCGRSSTPWRPWTTRTMAHDAVAVLDHLGVERAHVGGASLGGMAAQELALEWPERVCSLMLVSTTGGFRRPELLPGRGLARLLDVPFRSLRTARDPESRIREFLRMAATEDFATRCGPGDEAWDAVAAMIEDPTSDRGSALQLLAGIRHSTWSRLDRLSMPVQIHHCTEDPLIPIAAGRELARRIPHARFEVHAGAGHGLFERTERVGETNLAFLADAEAGAQADAGALV